MRLQLITTIILLSVFYNLFAQGDRNPDINCIYPEDAFLHNEKGGRILDITKAPFNAKGDGVTDDTEAFVKAYDWVLAEMDKYGWYIGAPTSYQCTYMIYIPNGTYRVTNTIIYSGPRRGDGPRENLARIRFVGQSREKTIIRLDDNSYGFGNYEFRAVLSFAKSDFNHGVAYNSVRNLTIDTGSGNPGAIGLDFCGANNSSLQNITVKSGDGNGSTGIHIRIGPTHGYYNDITVDGFDMGIRVTPYHHTSIAFEHITLKNQNITGFLVENGSASIRKLLSKNDVPALKVTEDGGHAILLDSKLQGNYSGAAIGIEGDGQLFARNIEIEGYLSEIEKNNKIVDLQSDKSGYIEEYISGEVFTIRQNQEKKSLNLPIEEVPIVEWEQDLTQWANVDDFGAVGDGETDDTDAIQAAMESGKTTIYFPKADYKMNDPVSIPTSVKRLNFMYGRAIGVFKIVGSSASPLVIEDALGTGARLEHYGPRTLIVNNYGGRYRNHNSEGSGTKVFLNAVCNAGIYEDAFSNEQVWCRFINTEYKDGPNFICNNSDMWVLGYKVEGNATNFKCINNGRLEVLGGVTNEHGWSDDSGMPPLLINDNSNVCYVGCTNGPNRFEIIIEELNDGKTDRLLHDQFPTRDIGTSKDVFIPMYVSYDDNGTASNNIHLDSELEKLDFLYNRLSEELIIKRPKSFDSLTVFDLQGQNVIHTCENKVSLSGMARGLYIINIDGFSKKLVLK